jgi:hypothetical protein
VWNPSIPLSTSVQHIGLAPSVAVLSLVTPMNHTDEPLPRGVALPGRDPAPYLPGPRRPRRRFDPGEAAFSHRTPSPEAGVPRDGRRYDGGLARPVPVQRQDRAGQ